MRILSAIIISTIIAYSFGECNLLAKFGRWQPWRNLEDGNPPTENAMFLYAVLLSFRASAHAGVGISKVGS